MLRTRLRYALTAGVVLALFLPAAHASDIGISVVTRSAGLEVYKIAPLSLAAQMKLQKGDLILKVNQKDMKTPKDLQDAVWNVKALEMVIKRKGKEITLKGDVYWPPPGKSNPTKTTDKVFFPKMNSLPRFLKKK